MLFQPFRIRAVRKLAAIFASFALAGGVWADSTVTVKGAINRSGKYTGANPKVFTPTKAVSTAGVAPVKGHLNAGRSVTVNTASTHLGTGDLSVVAEIALTGRRNLGT